MASGGKHVGGDGVACQLAALSTCRSIVMRDGEGGRRGQVMHSWAPCLQRRAEAGYLVPDLVSAHVPEVVPQPVIDAVRVGTAAEMLTGGDASASRPHEQGRR